MTAVALVATFPCTSCQKAHPLSDLHESGYCAGCMEKGRRFWLDRWELWEISEVANWIWPEAFWPEELAA